MSVTTQVCTWIAANRPEASFRTRDVVSALKIDASQVSNVLRTLTDNDALRIVTGNGGRGGNVYQVRNLQAVRLRSFADRSTPAPDPAPAAAVDTEHASDEQEFLTYALDHDGDLQVIHPDGTAFTIDNANARRLVAFVALQASAILMAGAG